MGLHLHLHLCASYYIMDTAHCTTHVYSACCTFITSQCTHSKVAWVGSKDGGGKMNINFPVCSVLFSSAVLKLPGKLGHGGKCANVIHTHLAQECAQLYTLYLEILSKHWGNWNWNNPRKQVGLEKGAVISYHIKVTVYI